MPKFGNPYSTMPPMSPRGSRYKINSSSKVIIYSS